MKGKSVNKRRYLGKNFERKIEMKWNETKQDRNESLENFSKYVFKVKNNTWHTPYMNMNASKELFSHSLRWVMSLFRLAVNAYLDNIKNFFSKNCLIGHVP